MINSRGSVLRCHDEERPIEYTIMIDRRVVQDFNAGNYQIDTKKGNPQRPKGVLEHLSDRKRNDTTWRIQIAWLKGRRCCACGVMHRLTRIEYIGDRQRNARTLGPRLLSRQREAREVGEKASISSRERGKEKGPGR